MSTCRGKSGCEILGPSGARHLLPNGAPCYPMVWQAVLCWAMLSYAVLYNAVLRYAVLYAMVCYAILRSALDHHG